MTSDLIKVIKMLANESTTYTAEQAGYVYTTTPRKCGTCEYFAKPDVCTLPLSISVDPELGCCNYWAPEEKKKDDVMYKGTTAPADRKE